MSGTEVIRVVLFNVYSETLHCEREIGKIRFQVIETIAVYKKCNLAIFVNVKNLHYVGIKKCI